MCGICGFYSKSSTMSDDVIQKMCSAISHRGPNDKGSWKDINLGIVLGHQRLSIIDLSRAGNQPMQSNSGRFVLTYNGEIYNHLELRAELKTINSNIKWRSKTDTETLLEALEFWGIDATLKKLVGMFAFALWDKKLHSLTLAKDRMGEKPLYFGWQGFGENSVFLFGSELKALKAHPGFVEKINRDAIALQLRHNYIPAPYSIYKDIYKLLPGHYLQLNENDLKRNLLPTSKPYWSLVDVAVSGVNNPLSLAIEEITSELDQLLRTSIKKQMMSDVPLGAFLSGGIDSSTVVALMQTQSSRPVKTFTIGFNEDDYNEAKYAKEVSRHLGTDHTELYVSAEQAMEVIPKLCTIYDEPFSDSSQIPTFLVSQLAKQHVSVSLSGDGGDELFCGYNRYLMTKNWWKKLRSIPLPLRKILSSSIKSISPQHWNKLLKLLPSLNFHNNFGDKMHKGADVLDSKNLSDLYYRLVSHFKRPSEIVINSKEPNTFLTNYKPEMPGLDEQQQMMALDSISYLPDDILVKVDRAAMATSLETRVPFLDHRVVEYIWQIPQSLKLRNGQSKWILRQILYQYVPKKLIERPKMGFGIPIDSWLRGPLRDWAENLLNETRLQQEGYLNSDQIRIKWTEHLSGKRNWQYHLWDILMFQSWLETNKNKNFK
jgi:asparagine synthase (glutamine-hydrolysing)